MVTIFNKPGGGPVFMIWVVSVLISILNILTETSFGWIGLLAGLVAASGFIIGFLALVEPLF